MAKARPKVDQSVVVSAPNMQTITFEIVGTAPYVQNKFPAKAREQMKAKQQAGQSAKKGAVKEAKDFADCYKQALHTSSDGWHGLPAPGVRSALISACRMVGFAMTRAKLSLFCEADGWDADDGTPLVKITKGKPRYVEHAVILESGVRDIRPRPMWDAGWEAKVRITFDADQFTSTDVANLMLRAGLQVGVGEGRPDSKKSAGQGWGTFAFKR